jgi:selenide, water dikinase
METMDDAGVYRLTPDLALVQTLDFFQPVVNDPRTFGRIVAANSLSDVWAMGGRALTAMNILAYPAKTMPEEIISELLIGAAEKLQEANVVLVGGHSMEQEQMFYGMSVTGTIHPDRIVTNARARAGHTLILTKPLGTSIYAEALAKDRLTTSQCDEYSSSMERLNMYASGVLGKFDVSAMTDVTGFGLLGHALPIARNAGVTLVLHASRIPCFSATFSLMEEFRSSQAWKSKQYVEPHTQRSDAVTPQQYMLMTDPQTSGGLLAAVPPEHADEIIRALHSAGDTAACQVGEVVPLVHSQEGRPIFLNIEE